MRRIRDLSPNNGLLSMRELGDRAAGELAADTDDRDHTDYEFLHDGTARGLWEHEVFHDFVDYLRDRRFTVDIRDIRQFMVLPRDFFGGKKPFEIELGHSLALLRDRSSERYWVLDCGDWSLPFTNHIQAFAADRRCVAVLKCQWLRRDYNWVQRRKILPWSYFETHPRRFQDQVDILRAHHRDHGHEIGLFFRGNSEWCERKPVLEALEHLGLLSVDFRGYRPYEDYLREMASHRLALGLPGFGNLCHREIEAFGMGVPVIMPKHRNRTAEPLEPGIHYIGVDTDPEREPVATVAKKLADCYHQVIEDAPLLRSISDAALDWYERNVRRPQSFDLALRVAGLTAPNISP